MTMCLLSLPASMKIVSWVVGSVCHAQWRDTTERVSVQRHLPPRLRSHCAMSAHLLLCSARLLGAGSFSSNCEVPA